MKIFYSLSIVIGLLFINIQSFAQQNVLKGHISDEKLHTSLAGASIIIPDLQLFSIADSNGNYQLHKLPSGTYLVQVKYTSFKTVTRIVHITGTTIADFSISEEAIEESAVVITGSSKATQIKRNPVPIVSVSHEYLQTNLSTNIIDAISKIPGVSALTTGPNVSKPFIRGLGYNRILTLFDGVRQEGQQWGDEHGIEVDQYGVDRIEVIKGPASLTYGSDALAGVVNLIPTPAAAEGKKISNATIDYQSNNGLFGGSILYGSTHKGLELMARLSSKEATNYQNKIDGRVFNTAFKETDAGMSLGLHGKWGYSHLGLSLFDDLQEIPDGSRDSATGRFTQQITEADTFRPVVSAAALKSYAITPLHQHVQHYRAYVSNNFRVGGGQLLVNLGFQNSVRREFSHPQVPYQDIAGLYLQLNTFSYDIKYHFAEFDGWNLSAGVNGMYQKNTATNGTEFVIPSYNQFDIGPFAMIKKTFNKLDISGGLRYDTRSFHNDEMYTKPNAITGFDGPVTGADTIGASHPFYNYNHVFTGVSGSVGATYNFTSKLALKINVSRGYRAPNISEISANGVHPGTGFAQIGNDAFQSEFSLQEDLGVSYIAHHLDVEFSVFNNNVSNYIYNRRLTKSTGAGDSLTLSDGQYYPTYKFQQGTAELYGGELSVDIHPLKSLHFENSISAVFALNKSLPSNLTNDSNRYLPFIPPVHGISELKYDFSSKKYHLANGFVKAQLAYYATQNRVYLTDNTETATAGYTLVNIGAGTGFTNKKGKTVATISLMVNNLFDIAYRDHLSRLKYFYYSANDTNSNHGLYSMGRNIGLKLEVPFI